MRLDKFLKLSRLIKRRTLANTFCDEGGVLIGDKPAKASSLVKINDILTLLFYHRTLVVKVLKVPEKTPSIQEASSLYEIISESRIPALKTQKQLHDEEP